MDCLININGEFMRVEKIIAIWDQLIRSPNNSLIDISNNDILRKAIESSISLNTSLGASKWFVVKIIQLKNGCIMYEAEDGHMLIKVIATIEPKGVGVKVINLVIFH